MGLYTTVGILMPTEWRKQASRAAKEAALLRATISLKDDGALNFSADSRQTRIPNISDVRVPVSKGSSNLEAFNSSGSANPTTFSDRHSAYVDSAGLSSGVEKTAPEGPEALLSEDNQAHAKSSEVQIPTFYGREGEEEEACNGDDNPSELEVVLRERMDRMERDLARLDVSRESSTTPQAANEYSPRQHESKSSGLPLHFGPISFPGAKRREGSRLDLEDEIRAFCAWHLGIKRLTGPSGELIETDYPQEPTDVNTAWQTKGDLEKKVFTYAWSQPPGHPFNRRAVDILALEMVESRGFSETELPKIRKMITTHFKHLRIKWKEQQRPPALELTVYQRIYKANKSRCDRLFAANLKLIAETPSLAHLVCYWSLLGTQGTSTDEEVGKEDGRPVYAIFKKTWRSAELNFFCRFLGIYLIHADRALRVRRPSTMESVRKAPKRLPINWYRPDFLKGLLPAEYHELDPGAEVSLEIPADLLTACHLNVDLDEDEGMEGSNEESHGGK
ncbi:hypothetical protein FRB90_000590 [Tulasnella sp. 427]|nr:hypothetical protein FRB90_000590 [Tulasnella sp. 427]